MNFVLWNHDYAWRGERCLSSYKEHKRQIRVLWSVYVSLISEGKVVHTSTIPGVCTTLSGDCAYLFMLPIIKIRNFAHLTIK